MKSIFFVIKLKALQCLKSVILNVDNNGSLSIKCGVNRNL